MDKSADYKNSLASTVAGQISDLAQSLNKNHILDEINLYGTSDKDGSVTMSFEWLGSIDQKPANDILDFFKEIKHMLIGCGSEIQEQVGPSLSEMCGVKRVIYRFRAFPVDGSYGQPVREVANK